MQRHCFVQGQAQACPSTARQHVFRRPDAHVVHGALQNTPSILHSSSLGRCCCSSSRCILVASASAGAVAEAGPAMSVQQDGLVLPLGLQGAWDEAAVGSPVVRCFVGDNEDRWFMWYSGRGRGDAGMDAIAPAAGSIGVAVSGDGICWQRGHGSTEGARGQAKDADVGRVLEPNKEDWWWLDTRHLSVSDVQMFSSNNVSGAGVYWMYYSGANFEPGVVPDGLEGLASGSELEGLRARAGLAMSQDGRNWARIEAPEHHTAAVLDAGQPGDWDASFVTHPQVVAVSPTERRMYYGSFDAASQKWTVGSALSRDGFVWRKEGPMFAGDVDGGGFDGRGAAACHVTRDLATKQWVMFYEAVAQNNRRSIGMAVSRDGRSGWRRLGRPILEAGLPGAWDAGGVGAPCPVSMADGRWRLYYHGQSSTGGCARGVGLALTDKEDAAEFEGVRCAFKRRQWSGV